MKTEWFLGSFAYYVVGKNVFIVFTQRTKMLVLNFEIMCSAEVEPGKNLYRIYLQCILINFPHASAPFDSNMTRDFFPTRKVNSLILVGCYICRRDNWVKNPGYILYNNSCCGRHGGSWVKSCFRRRRGE